MPSESQPAPLSPAGRNRGALLERLERETFDIAVIGGGITGAGIAHDAALRGLSVALLEKADFGSGTSGRSSRLIHGGLRYLRHGQVRLVRESLRERGYLIRLAPHLVRPAPFVLPVFEDSGDSALILRVGLIGYDLLAGTLGIGRHHVLPREKLTRNEPQLRTRGLRSGLGYFEALTDDARLTLAVTLSAVDRGATVLNYVEAVGLETTGERVAGVHYRDLVGGAEGTVRARVVVSAAGPWTDQVRSLARLSELLRPTKGIHVVVPRTCLAPNATVAFSFQDRALFAIPTGEHTYIGTTDTDYSGDPGTAEADRDDVAYVLEAANGAFEVDLSPADVTAVWAGVRPLVAEEGAPSDVSRDYVIEDGPPGFYTITGGKLTTFRSMAEHLLDHVIEHEGDRLAVRPARCSTKRRPLPGGDISNLARYEATVLPDLRERSGLSEEAARRLVAVYGTEHSRVLAHAAGREELLQPLAPVCPVLGVEASYAAREQMCLTLEDFLRTRSRAMFAGANDEAVEAAAHIMAGALDWSPEETARQKGAYRAAVERMLAFRLPASTGDGEDRLAASGGGADGS